VANQGTSFGVLLKRYRLEAGLSQEALAERAHVSARAISSYERGLRQAPYRGSLAQLIRALQLSPVERQRLEAAVQRRRAPRSSGGTSNYRTNLPVQRTSFVGRGRETAEVTRLLERTRLLTLVGSGGCGKTRLALHVAGELLSDYPDGVWLVDLAPLSDPKLVPRSGECHRTPRRAGLAASRHIGGGAATQTTPDLGGQLRAPPPGLGDLEDERSTWMARDMQARVWMNRGDYLGARSVFADQLGAMRRRGYAFGVASALIGLGVVARLQADCTQAVAWCEECLEVSRHAGDVWFVGQALSNSGLAYYQLGRPTRLLIRRSCN
jgi:transcriptional regulator with XRE-family HTH domain